MKCWSSSCLCIIKDWASRSRIRVKGFMVFNATFNNISVISWQTFSTDDYLMEVITIEMNSITQPLELYDLPTAG